MNKKKKNSRQCQAENTKQRIWEESGKLISRMPISKIKIEDITNACGISKGAFYHYFSSKVELFSKMALVPGYKASLVAREDTSASPVKRICNYFIWRLAEVEQNGIPYTRNVQGFRLSDTYRVLRDEWYHHEHYEYNMVMKIFAEAVEAGSLSPDFPADTVAQMIVYLMHGAVYNQCLYDEKMELVQWGKRFCELLEQVILKPYMPNP